MRILLIFLFSFITFQVWGDPLPVFDFEDSSQNELFKGQETAVVDGKLRVTFPAYKNSTFQHLSCSLPSAIPSDWSGFSSIQFEIHNPMKVEQEIGFKPDAKGSHSRYFEIKPGKTRTIKIPLAHLKDYADMKHVKGLTFTLRPHVKKLSFPTRFHLDSFSLMEMSMDSPDAIQVRVVKPKYRKSIYSSYPVDEIIASIETGLAPGYLTNFESEITFYADDTQIKSEKFTLSRNSQRFQCDLRHEAGIYQIELSIYDKNSGKRVRTITEKVRRLPAEENEVVIDQENNLRINGEVFLPIGIYFTGPVDHMKYIEKNGFNCIAPYHPPSKEFHEEASRLGLKMMPNFVTDRNIGLVLDYEELDEDALELFSSKEFLGYYLYDEPQPAVVPPQQVYNDLSEYARRDPYHPAYICCNTDRQYYGHDYAPDVMMVDAYAMPGDLAELIEAMEDAEVAMEGRGPVWFVGQIFSNWVYNDYWMYDQPSWRMVTYDEIRAYTWMALLKGAKGLFYYNYHTTRPDVIQRIAFPKMWKGLGYITAELKTLKDVVLSDQHRDLEVICEEELVRAQLRKVDGDEYIILVNGSQHPVECSVEVGGIEEKLMELGSPGEPVLEDGLLRVVMPGQMAKVYTTSQRMARRFMATIPVEEIRRELEEMDDGVQEDGENNLAMFDKGARLSASWEFPDMNERTEYGRCRTTPWNRMIDGNRATKWVLGEDGRYGDRYVWPDKKIYQGRRWIEVSLPEKAPLGKVIVTTTPDMDLSAACFVEGQWRQLERTKSRTTGKYHYELEARVEHYKAKGCETDKIRVYINTTSDAGNPPTLFEIEALKAQMPE
jgi:hypothetical protein